MAKAKKAIVLLSGGIDSTTTLYLAKRQGYECHALIFDYGQRHRREIRSAVAVAKCAKISYRIMKIRLPWGGSSLLDKSKKVPKGRPLSKISSEVPSTYVPARNTIFLSFALSYAEAIDASAIFIGANAVDYSGYPDCRPSFYHYFQRVAEEGTKKKTIRIKTPLIKMTKAGIIDLGLRLKAPLHETWSCYVGGRRPCGACDSCILRQKGFSSIIERT